MDVKTTTAVFDRVLHISLAELHEMHRSDEPYDLYRLYELNGNRGRLRIAKDMAEFAGRILDGLTDLPKGVTVDSISVLPDMIVFGKEVIIELPPNQSA